jgi:cold shock protein
LLRKLSFARGRNASPKVTITFSTFFHPIFMDTGSIKKLLNGFGFISREGGDDLFFHSEDLVDVDFNSLNEGDSVQFEVGSGPKGPKATKVSMATDAPEATDAAPEA